MILRPLQKPSGSAGIRPDANVLAGITSHHEVYEDLGIHSKTVVDQSFNVNNFPCETMSENDPGRALAFECSLSGSTRITDHVRQLSSGRQSPYSLPGLTGSVSASPTSPAFNAQQLLGVHEPISEMACTGPGGPCYGENGELGFSVRNKQKKKRYWLDSNAANTGPFTADTGKQGGHSVENIYECSTVGLRSFSPIVEQECTASDFLIPSIQEKACTKSGDPIPDNFQFPSWDQLPADFQNPTTSADYNSTIPVSTTGVSMPTTEGTTSDNPTAWDDNELNFAMDMDMDFDLDLNMLEK